MSDRTAEVMRKVAEEFAWAEPPRKMWKYVEELLKWGERIHLTGKKDLERAIAAQISDSMTMLELAREGRKVADIGSGAGFPGIVWQIARPELSVALFERKERLASFLVRTAAILGLDRMSVIGEDAACYKGGEKFDIVVSKAAGRLGEILPVAAGMLCSGGVYITAKGGGWEEELESQEKFSPRERMALKGGRGEAISILFDV
jgi:16S rRNA (guanine527-N7)-methyltransferase